MVILNLIRSLFESRSALLAENLALRQQLAVLRRTAPRPKVLTRDRVFWVLLRRIWGGWRGCLHIVQPETVIRWHRLGWRLVWRAKSKGKPGRPPIPLEVRDLIQRMSRENRFWGAPRIKDELATLGYEVAKSTVEKYMDRAPSPPSPTWRAFLRNQATEILAADFFTIPTATFKSITGFVVVELGRRRILAIGATASPSASWATTMLRRAVLRAGRSVRYLLRDRDSIYGEVFNQAAQSLGLSRVVTAYKAPRMNAHCERLIGSIRRELLDHVIVMGEGHATLLLEEYGTYYNETRCHQGLDGDSPEGREPPSSGQEHVVATSHLGGLHHSYRRAA